MQHRTPELLLHHLGPYLPTDRFRALLAGYTLPENSQGAAMIVDVSGFTPLTVKLVEEFGPQRASEELKRRLNPMFEALAGLVFTHGGSVIRFVGDGFTAWFGDELPHKDQIVTPLPGALRAAVAAIEMLETMVFFKDLDIKVAINAGSARRWVVGDAAQGLLDTLVGPSVEGVGEVAGRCQRHEARAGKSCLEVLTAHPHLHFRALDDEGDLLLTRASGLLVEQSRGHRWAAWQAQGDVGLIVEQVKQFIDPFIQQQEIAGLGNLAGELRYVTPVFLRFAGLDYNHDREARAKLDAYVRDVQRILQTTQGRLVSLEVADKGSVLYAVFGAPIAYGDDSQRAVHATLAFKRLRERHPEITEQNIGVSRGLLYSGTVGGEVRHEYTSLGDETNVASRLMSADLSGNILISQAVYQDCSDWFDFHDGEIISPKGRMGKVKTFVPLRVRSRARRDLRKTPLLGREVELTLLGQQIKTLEQGRAALLHVEGEAGIGKSRFAAELIYQAQEAGYRVAVGHCLSTGQFIAGLPWLGIVRSVMRLEDEWNAQMQLDHLEQWFENHNRDWLPRLPLLAADLLGLTVEENATTRNLSGIARQQALLSLVIDILYKSASNRPIVIILEDIHWMDEVSANLSLELASRLSNDPAPILFGLFQRPLEAESSLQALEGQLASLPILRRVNLSELSLEAVGELIEHQMGGIIPMELTRFVYERSQGNPFFAQAITESLKESQIIERVGPRVYIDDNLNKIALPQTVQGLILARLDNLPETEKLILKLAAVIGKRFEIRVLYQSLPLELAPEGVMEYLRSLERYGFTQLETLYPEPVYTFRHAITQEVTYQTLLYDQRRQWHHNVGLVLETLQPESWERLAYHFAQTDDRQRAYVYLVRSGDRSAHEFANQAALDYWAQAIQFTNSAKEKFDLICKRLELLMRTADQEAIQRDLQMLDELVARSPDNRNWALRQARYRAEHALNMGDWQASRDHAELGVALAEGYQDLQIAWDLYSIQTRIYANLNDEEQQQIATVKLRGIAEQLNEPSKGLRLILNDLQELAAKAPVEAVEALKSTYPQLVKLDDPILEGNYWDILSDISLRERFLDQAEVALKTQLTLWQRIGNRRREGITQHNLGTVLYFLGRYTEAGNALRESYSIARQVRDKWTEAGSLMRLGALAFRRKAYGEATAFITRALDYLNTVGSRVYRGRALTLLGLIEIEQGNYGAAQKHFLAALDVLGAAGLTDEMPQVEIALAYTNALGFTLPMPTSFEKGIRCLIDPDFKLFQDPDIAFSQAYILQKLFRQDLAPLRAAFERYLNEQLRKMDDPELRKAFLDHGETWQLIAALGLSI